MDDSFRTALQYLSTGFVGEEINIRILEDNAGVQRDLVETLKQQLLSQDQLVSAANQAVTDAVKQSVQGQESKDFLTAVHSIFDPLGITQTPDIGGATALQAQLDYAKEQLDRAEKERQKVESDLQVAITALQGAIDKLATATKEHFEKLTGVDRLRVHVKDNILSCICRQFGVMSRQINATSVCTSRCPCHSRHDPRHYNQFGWLRHPSVALFKRRVRNYDASYSPESGCRDAKAGGRGGPRYASRLQRELYDFPTQRKQLLNLAHDAGLLGSR